MTEQVKDREAAYIKRFKQRLEEIYQSSKPWTVREQILALIADLEAALRKMEV